MSSTMAAMAAGATAVPLRQINAIVVSAGLMDKTVRARIGTLKWHNHLRKKLPRNKHVLVHDHNNSLRAGDAILITPGVRMSKHVHYAVTSIVAPFENAIEDRPPVSLQELVKEKLMKKMAKQERRAERAKGQTKEAVELDEKQS